MDSTRVSLHPFPCTLRAWIFSSSLGWREQMALFFPSQMWTCLRLLKSIFWEVTFASPCIFATRASKNQFLTHTDRFFLTGTGPEYSWVVNLQLDDIYCLFNPNYVPGTSVHHWILISIPPGNDFYQHLNSERLRNLSRNTQLWMVVLDLAFKSHFFSPWPS